MEAIRNSDRAYIFDNSDVQRWIAEVINGRELDLKTDSIPDWFKRAVWDKFS